MKTRYRAQGCALTEFVGGEEKPFTTIARGINECGLYSGGGGFSE
jgi:hypothetical protein